MGRKKRASEEALATVTVGRRRDPPDLRPSFWTRWLGLAVPAGWELWVDPERVTVESPDKDIELSFGDIESLAVDRRFLHSTLRIVGTRKEVRLRGGRHGETEAVCQQIHTARAAFLEQQLQRVGPRLRDAMEDWVQLFRQERYVADSDYRTWLARWAGLDAELRLPRSVADLQHASARALAEFRELRASGRRRIEARNEDFVRAELSRCKRFFDTVAKNPLTDRQRRAVVTDEDRTLVIAGAGSGKTSVVVAKVGYLLERQIAAPSEVMLLAFTSKAAGELEERLRARGGDGVAASTFHSLGRRIVGDVEGRVPSLAPWVEDSEESRRLVRRLFDQLLRTSRGFLASVYRFFVDLLKPYRSRFECRTFGEYIQYLRSHDLRDLRGKKLRSYEECRIANFFYINRIAYEYEPKYEHETATRRKQQYRPDFYLPEHDIYVEHFGVARDGSTAPWVDTAAYWKEIGWKRRIHEKKGTKLIETYSYQHTEGTLLPELERNLRQRGVRIDPRSEREVLERFNEAGVTTQLEGLLRSFLTLYKARRSTIQHLEQRTLGRKDEERLRAFTAVFEEVLKLYEQKLRDINCIDFDDMILRATKYVESGAWQSPYRSIVVDEFQDISTSRYCLIKALLAQHPNSRLLCVGDDWQAIYRFAGGDLSIMTDFENRFGFTKKVILDRTFRFSDQLAEVSSKFILKNPGQTPKIIESAHRSTEPAIVLVYEQPEPERAEASGDANGERTLSAFVRTIVDIRERHRDGQPSVMVLGRYQHSKPNDFSLAGSYLPDIEYMTVHKSKGLEADYVVVVDMGAGRWAFPSEVADDPILDLVKADGDLFENAEERRLFYVALTRARRRVYLIAPLQNPSKFVVELEEGNYNIAYLGTPGIGESCCPKCETGRFVVRRGRWGPFLGCSNYPYCTETELVCPGCEKGRVHRPPMATGHVCTNCEMRFRPCRRCSGYLVEKNGGSFLGCSNYAKHNCRYTVNLS